MAAFGLQLKNGNKAARQCLLICTKVGLKPEIMYFNCPQKEIIPQTGDLASGWVKERVPVNPQGWALGTSLLPALLL